MAGGGEVWFADWAEVFGEFWFWVAAVMFWSGAGASLAGAPRGVIADGLTSAAEAGLARSVIRYRLARGRLRLAGPLATPIAGCGAAYLGMEATFGSALSLGALTALGPIIAFRLWAEERVGAAAREEDPAQATLLFDQLWRAQFGAVALSAAATVAAAALTQPLSFASPPIG